MPHGHVFVVPGDVRNIAADAWLLPGDRRPHVRENWLEGRPDLARAFQDLVDAGGMGTRHAIALHGDWASEAQPILIAVPNTRVQNAEDIAPALIEALRLAAELPHRTRRPRRLVALPLFGSRGGGGDRLRGELISAILHLARNAVRTHGMDVALVLQSDADLAQAQAIRRGWESWDALGPDLVTKARSLAEHARAGRLVPFLGAGVSMSAGLPSWNQLLESLAGDAVGTDEQAEFRQIPPLDQAHILRERIPEFNKAVADRTQAARYGLAPALLAGLRCREAVTLNYDELYEKAATDSGWTPAVLPQRAVDEDGRWLLKLHGTVTDPDSIVLTREDYLGYRHGREALSALAKAMLLTRHLLFVGFGLSDDHFHELMHDVREVLPAGDRGARRLGTSLELSPGPLRRALWGKDLDMVAMPGEGFAEQGRGVEVFLDCLLAHADQGLPHFLDRRYRHLLTEPELTLRGRILEFAGSVSEAERETPAWVELEAALSRLGFHS